MKLDVYYPTALDGAWPVVMYVHGGAWVKEINPRGRGSEISLL
jgi:acetyl esterase/lipase